MSTANVFTPTAYDERVFRLALGIELRDAIRGGRARGGVANDGARVTFDNCPRPLHEWRKWANSVTLDDVLPRMTRHETGRFVSLFERSTPTEQRVRITDRTRRYVPRRFALTIPSEADADDNPPARRVFAPELFPGAAYDSGSAMTGVRGRITRDGTPVRWARVRATQEGTDDELGWTHGDDRGEFLLLIGNPEAQVGFLDDPTAVTLTVGFADPSPQPDPTDPLVVQVDPLWDLVEEAAILPDDEIASGRTFPSSYDQFTPDDAFEFRHGRVGSIEIAVPT